MGVRLCKFWIFFLLFVACFYDFPAHSVTVDATDISNRAYFSATISEINNAKDLIYVAMYSAYLEEGDTGAVRDLINALIAARGRGVMVVVYLDSGKGNKKANLRAYDLLKSNGVSVYYLKPDIKLHAKTILIDNAVVIDGSANWTENALNKNIESNVILRSGEFAQGKAAFFDSLNAYIDHPAVVKRELVEKVRVDNAFLEDSRFAPLMVEAGDNHCFDLYIYLLLSRRGAEDKGAWFELDYIKTAQALGVKVERVHSKYRQDVRTIVETLKTRYGLIEYKLDKKNNISIRLVPLEGKGYFNVPLAYWDYGLSDKLRIGDKFTYFLAIHESELARPKIWWSYGLDYLELKYHLQRHVLTRGFMALEKLNIIEVRRGDIQKAPDGQVREHNSYRLKELLSPQEFTAAISALEKSEGKAMVADAIRCAAVMDKENDIYAIKDFIRLIKQYTLANVEEALSRVEHYRHSNPFHNDIGYLVGVLKKIQSE